MEMMEFHKEMNGLRMNEVTVSSVQPHRIMGYKSKHQNNCKIIHVLYSLANRYLLSTYYVPDQCYGFRYTHELMDTNCTL